MIGVKITDLPSITLPYSGTESIPLVQNNETRVGSISSFASYAVTPASIQNVLSTNAASTRTAIGVPPAPWQRDGCVAAWHCDYVTLSGTRVIGWTDLTGNGKNLTSPLSTAGVKGTRGVTLSARAYNITGGIPLDHRAHTVIWIGAANNLPDLNNMTGWLYQIGSAGPGCTWGAVNTYFEAPATYGPPPSFKSRNTVSYAIASGTTEKFAYSDGLKSSSLSPYNAGTGTLERIFGDSSGGTVGDNGPVVDTVATLVFNRQLNDYEIQEIVSWFGTTSDSSGDILLCEGNSFVLGTGATTADQIFFRAAALELGSRFSVQASSGRLFATVEATSVNAIKGVTGRRNIHIVFPGGNDLAANATATTIQGLLTSYCGKIRSSNPKAKSIICTLIPRGATASGYINGQTASGFDTQRTTLNSWISANYATIADGIADFTTLTAFDSQADADNTANYLSDKIHPNNTGHALMAGVLIDAIRAL